VEIAKTYARVRILMGWRWQAIRLNMTSPSTADGRSLVTEIQSLEQWYDVLLKSKGACTLNAKAHAC